MTRMAINPGIPIPIATPRVSLERPVNGAEDGEGEDVVVCAVDSVKVIDAGTDTEGFVVDVNVAVDVDLAEDDPD